MIMQNRLSMRGLAIWQALCALVGDYVTSYRDDLVIHDRSAINERPNCPFIHWARPCGTHIVFLPESTDSEYPAKGARVPYLFGTADREWILKGKQDIAFYHTEKRNSPEQYRAHYFNGDTLHSVTVEKALDIVAEYRRAIEREWNRPTSEQLASYLASLPSDLRL